MVLSTDVTTFVIEKAEPELSVEVEGELCEGEWEELSERAARDERGALTGVLGVTGGDTLQGRIRGAAGGATALRDLTHRHRAVLRADNGPAPPAPATPANNARRLRDELAALVSWLEPPPALDRPALDSAAGRERALEAASAVKVRLAATGRPGWSRLAADREATKRWTRARDRLAAAVARHVNDLFIQLSAGSDHHGPLLELAPLMGWLRDMDNSSFLTLRRQYVTTWSRLYERRLRELLDAANSQLAAAPPEQHNQIFDNVLTQVDSMCNAEEEFCNKFFYLDLDSTANKNESRRWMQELFPGLETELVALVNHMDKLDTFGAVRALVLVGGRALGERGEGGGGGVWGVVCVGAKRAADRRVGELATSYVDQTRQAARRPRAGLLPFLAEFDTLAEGLERVVGKGGRRAELDRWYETLARAMMSAILDAEHPRTPREVLRLENFHRLHAVLSERRVAALEPVRREARARYQEALKAYVEGALSKVLERLTAFFDGVAAAVAGGLREDEVRFRSAFSKQELKRVLALYPAKEVVRALRKLHDDVAKTLSEEAGLLQVVWRALQEELVARHVALDQRLRHCYPGTNLALPLTTDEILAAASEIAQNN